jgi:hypothetical protein
MDSVGGRAAGGGTGVDDDWAPLDVRWVLDEWSDGTRSRVWDLDGLSWSDAPPPRRWHRCTEQTYGVMDWFTVVKRCACGAISVNGEPWDNRNSRGRK